MSRSRRKIVSLFASIASACLLTAGFGGIASANPVENVNAAEPVQESALAAAAGERVDPVGVDARGRTLKAPSVRTTKKTVRNSGSVPAYVPKRNVGKSTGTESVIGPDGRTQVHDTTAFPNSAVVFIMNGGRHHCTGWMISRDTVVTAGHCLYDVRSRSWNQGLDFVPGANGRVQPYGSAKAARMWTDRAYVSSGDSGQDWGVVKLNRPLGERTGWFGLKWQGSSYNGTWSTVRGYPGDKPVGQMWTMSGSIDESRPNQLCYSIDTIGGQSGSPVYVSNNQVIAIHAYGVGPHGSGDCPSRYNAGTRITESLYDLILRLR